MVSFREKGRGKAPARGGVFRPFCALRIKRNTEEHGKEQKIHVFFSLKISLLYELRTK